MGLDIYVMPLWRFKVGDFLTPVEAPLGVTSRIVTLDGTLERGGRGTNRASLREEFLLY